MMNNVQKPTKRHYFLQWANQDPFLLSPHPIILNLHMNTHLALQSSVCRIFGGGFAEIWHLCYWMSEDTEMFSHWFLNVSVLVSSLHQFIHLHKSLLMTRKTLMDDSIPPVWRHSDEWTISEKTFSFLKQGKPAATGWNINIYRFRSMIINQINPPWDFGKGQNFKKSSK